MKKLFSRVAVIGSLKRREPGKVPDKKEEETALETWHNKSFVGSVVNSNHTNLIFPV